MTEPIDSILPLLANYDAFIIDLWGVVHDGSALYPGAVAALAAMHEQGKKICFLSNAPRRAVKAEAGLTHFGIARDQYDAIITSGETAALMLQENPRYGRRYYYLGPGKDEDVLDGFDYQNTSNPAQADFILNAGFEDDFQQPEAILPTLHSLLAHKLPLLCINPDLEVVKQDGTRMLCAGWVAARYAELGGTVDYIGKPYPQVYERCFAQCGDIDKSRILAIGDNLHTDITGANRLGIDSLLITGGILTSDAGMIPTPTMLEAHYSTAGARPTYCAPLLAL